MKLLLFFSFFIAIVPAFGQSYSQADQLKIADNASRLVRDKYLTNLDILTHYEANQPFEVLQSQLNGLLKDAFRDRNVLVYNEFRSMANAYTTVEEYVKDCRIFSVGKPVVNTLAIENARYQISQTKDGFPFINLFVEKQVAGKERGGKQFRFQNRVEIRITFTYDPQWKVFHSFKIAGITKVEQWPSTAFTFTANELEMAEKTEKDLFSILATLADQLKTAFPAGVKQVVLDRFTYNRCGINDALSDRIFATLSSCLQKQAGVEVLSPAQVTDDLFWVRGYYQEDLTNLRVVAEGFDSRTNQVLAKMENADLPLAWISQQKLRLKPDHYQQVIAMQDTLRQNSVAGSTLLAVELRTDRGRTGVEYWQGNQMTIEAKVNRPCHLRLIYVLADGTKTVLENDIELKTGHTNQFVRISPDASYVCAEPFGTEYLLAYASETAFCSIPSKPNARLYLRKENGYGILVGSLTETLLAVKCTGTKTAGAEDQIQITTRGVLK